jgi:basic membrane lipoprotein Med (substrate-binding protein (PBP1-ABC) superfamily)
MIHPDIRTYYGRIHEAKFLVGAIAGALADDNRIGYVATYPTYGMVAGINAFAMGAKMVNPRAKVYLEWTAVKNRDIDKVFADLGVDVISNLDMRAPEQNSPKFGLYRMENGAPHNYAMPFWQWGQFYTRIVSSIFDGTWKDENNAYRAINYWWGMAAGVVDVVCSHSLPADTMRLVTLLRQAITQQEYEPFSGVLRGQNGVLYGRENTRMTPEEIITMDWLADNVVGHIPTFDELIEEAKPLVLLQGVNRETI